MAALCWIKIKLNISRFDHLETGKRHRSSRSRNLPDCRLPAADALWVASTPTDGRAELRSPDCRDRIGERGFADAKSSFCRR